MDDLVQSRSAECSGHFEVNIIDALYTGRGHQRDREPHRKCDKKYIRFVRCRKCGQCQRDPRCRRDRSDDLRDRIEPVSHDFKVTEHKSCQKSDTRSPHEARCQKFQRIADIFQKEDSAFHQKTDDTVQRRKIQRRQHRGLRRYIIQKKQEYDHARKKWGFIQDPLSDLVVKETDQDLQEDHSSDHCQKIEVIRMIHLLLFSVIFDVVVGQN